jgi:hypothetical protein
LLFDIQTIADPRPDELTEGLRRIRKGELQGLLLKSVVEPQQLEVGVAKLKSNQHTLEKYRFAPGFPGWTYGLNLDLAAPDLDDYTAQVEPTLSGLRDLFGWPLFEHILKKLEELAHPLPLKVPQSRQGTPYLPVTIRRLPEGGLLPPHVGNEQKSRAPYADLNTKIGAESMMSYFLMLQTPESGGELRVHDIQDSELTPADFYRGRLQVDHKLEGGVQHHTVAPQAGDLLVFDGGRWVHEVLQVKGPKTRWTLGGFLAFSEDVDRVWIWA